MICIPIQQDVLPKQGGFCNILYSIELEYLGSDSDIADMESLIDGSKLTVQFIHNGTQAEAVMYPSDRVNETEIILNGKGRHRLSFTLIEV